MIKLHVNVCRKLGRPDFGSVGASCGLEVEVKVGDGRIVEFPDAESIRKQVRHAYRLCEEAVAEELARLTAEEGSQTSLPPKPTVEPERPPAKQKHEWEGRRPRAGQGGRPPGTDRAPTTGKGLFRWLKEQEEKIGAPGLIGYVNRWGKLQEFGGKIVEWTGPEVADAYREAVRKLAEIAAAPAELQEEARP